MLVVNSNFTNKVYMIVELKDEEEHYLKGVEIIPSSSKTQR